MTGMIKVINILLILIVAFIVLGCANPHKEQTKNESTIQKIPEIVKALEAIGSVGKKQDNPEFCPLGLEEEKVDKDNKK